MKNNQKGSASFALIAVIVVLVAIGGYFAWSNKTQPVIQESIPTQIPKDETVGWKTYTNEEYGFELKYPLDWIYKPLDDADEGAGIDGAETDSSIYRLRFASQTFFEDRRKDNKNFTIEVVPQESKFYNRNLREFVNSLTARGGFKTSFKETRLIIAGADDSFTRDESFDGQSFRIVSFVKKDGNIYVMSAGFSDSPTVVEMYSKILSTFKFPK